MSENEVKKAFKRDRAGGRHAGANVREHPEKSGGTARGCSGGECRCARSGKQCVPKDRAAPRPPPDATVEAVQRDGRVPRAGDDPHDRLSASVFAGDSEGNEPPVLGGSPFEDVQSAADLEEKLGFVIDAPEGAENVTYCIYDGEIACVDFTLDGHEYTYEAAKLDGNFSRAEGEAVGSTALNAEYGAVLDRVSPDTWRAHWNRDDVSYYLTNFDGAEESAITEIADTLMKSN